MNKFLLLALITFQAHAFPVFFHCDKNGVAGDIESSKELTDSLDQMKGLSDEEMDDLAADYCKGSEECIARLKQAGILSKVSYEIVSKYYQDELLSLNADSPGVEVPSSNVQLLKKLKSMKELIACRKAQQKIASPDKDKMQMYYPFHSNYMFATGCRQLNGKDCINFSKPELKEAVKRAVLAGVDPYLFVALAMQEGGVTNSPLGLYLDPIGVIKAIGCDGKSTKASDKKAFDSYGTYYSVKNGVLNRPDVTEYFEKYFADRPDVKKRKSYLCNDVQKAHTIEVTEKPRANSCCLEIPYATDADTAAKHLVPFYIKDMQSKAIPYGQKDPAFTVQLYNGYSNLMGGAEGVSLFRTGLNFFKEPSYGYQGMDFIVNSLMVNKDLKELVDEEQKKMGVSSPSIICKGKAEGYYSMDSDYYFNKHKKSQRMGVILEKYRKGLGYESLTEREKRVIDKEITSQEVTQKLGIKDIFSPGSYETSKNNLMNYDIRSNLLYSDMVDKATFDKNMSKFGLPAAKLNSLYDYQKLSLLAAEYSATNEWPQGYQFPDDEKIEKYVETFIAKSGPSGLLKMKDYSDEDALVTMKALGQANLDKMSEKDLKLSWKITLKEIYNEAVGSASDQMSPIVMTASEGASFKRRSVEEIMGRLAEVQRTDEVKKKIESYFSHVDSAKENKVLQKGPLFKRYFKEVYKERETVEQASAYPWKRFTDEEVEQLGQQKKY